MSKVAIIIMVIAAIGMIFGVSKQKAGTPWGKPLAVLCAIVALICAISHIAGTRTPSMTTVIAREMAYQKVSAQKLAMYLAEKFPGSKALVLVQPGGGGAPERENALVSGLREGFGDKVTIVAELAPEIPEAAKQAFIAEMPPQEPGAETPDSADVIPPLEYWYSAAVFDKAVKDYEGKIDLVVTTIGLPQDPGHMDFWGLDPRPKLAIVSGSIYRLKKAIQSQAIAAAVTYSPAAVYEDTSPPADVDKAFAKRFLLVTPENIGEIAAKHTDLFMNN